SKRSTAPSRPTNHRRRPANASPPTTQSNVSAPNATPTASAMTPAAERQRWSVPLDPTTTTHRHPQGNIERPQAHNPQQPFNSDDNDSDDAADNGGDAMSAGGRDDRLYSIYCSFL
ncbi:hypothetical protein EDB84DRAFT_1446315, partial [Lactarius hengduanensis]